jgi:hypothetical protein
MAAFGLAWVASLPLARTFSLPGGLPEMKKHLLALLVVVVTILVVLWPLPFGTSILGHPLSDAADHFWGDWWWGGEVLAGRFPTHTAITHLPAGSDLWYVDPVGAAFALIFRPLGMVAAFNLALAADLLLAGLGTYLVAFRRNGSAFASACGAVAVLLSPYLLGLLDSGLCEYVGLGFPVLFLGALLELLDRPPERRWWPIALLSGLLLALCTLQAFYYGLMACLTLACLVPGPDLRKRAIRLGLALVVGLLLSSPLLWMARTTLGGGATAVNTASAPSWHQAIVPATDLSLFLRPGKHYFPDTVAMGNSGILQVHYLGWVLLVSGLLGIATSRRMRRFLPATLLYGLCALGPAAAWLGRLPGGHGIPLLLYPLYKIPFSPFAWVHHPYRYVAFLIPLLAWGFAELASRLRRPAALVLLGLLVTESLALSPAVWPIPRFDTAPPAVYASLPEPGGVLDWPPDATSWNRDYETWQVYHGRPIPYGVNVFLPEAFQADPLVADLLFDLDDPRRRARNRDVDTPYRPIPPTPRAPSELARLGVRQIVTHVEAFSSGEWGRTRSTLVRWLGEPVSIDADTRVWRIPESALEVPR